jgi:hypothetical protein
LIKQKDMKTFSFTLILAISVMGLLQLPTFADEFSYHPPNGMVPDAETAKRIAEAVWLPIYGKKIIDSEKPFKVHLKGDVWIVEGADLPKDWVGGVALAEIAKSDGRILRISHGK